MTAGIGRRAPLALALLMVTVSMVPLAVADIRWSGPDELQITASNNPSTGGGPATGGGQGEVTVNGFDIESNGTVLDAWLEVSTGGRPNSTIPIGWAADDPSGNFSYGIHSNTSATLFDGELSLSTKETVGRVHDWEQISHRFQDWPDHRTPRGWHHFRYCNREIGQHIRCNRHCIRR